MKRTPNKGITLEEIIQYLEDEHKLRKDHGMFENFEFSRSIETGMILTINLLKKKAKQPLLKLEKNNE